MGDKELEKNKKELNFFEVTPKIVEADKKSTIEIKPLYDNFNFGNNKEFKVIYKPIHNTSEPAAEAQAREFTVTSNNGKLFLNQYFAGEQEHIFIISEKEDEVNIGDFHIYSLRDDLYCRKPLKGDLHLHTSRSDGEGSPGYIAALGRKRGFDFMAVTDHRRYTPSVEAQNIFGEAAIDINLINGEEVHPPENPVHLVNFGGDFSINDLYEKDSFNKEVNQIMEKIENVPAGVKEYQYASCVWSCEKIREAGGLAIFSHPYWINENQYYISDKLTTFLLRKKPYDALEIINGSISSESNNLQVLKYYNSRAEKFFEGKRPVLGVSDAHHCDLGIAYSIVFTKDNSKRKIIENIKKEFSVAVNNQEQSLQIYGPDRLVKYAYFLMREIFPYHDRLCREEGNYMMKYINNDNYNDKLRQLQGRTEDLYKKLGL